MLCNCIFNGLKSAMLVMLFFLALLTLILPTCTKLIKAISLEMWITIGPTLYITWV